MAKKRYTAEQIINHLREAEIHLSRGKTVREAVSQIVVTEQTYYRWRKEYGGMDVSQARRPKELEKESTPFCSSMTPSIEPTGAPSFIKSAAEISLYPDPPLHIEQMPGLCHFIRTTLFVDDDSSVLRRTR